MKIRALVTLLLPCALGLATALPAAGRSPQQRAAHKGPRHSPAPTAADLVSTARRMQQRAGAVTASAKGLRVPGSVQPVTDWSAALARRHQPPGWDVAWNASRGTPSFVRRPVPAAKALGGLPGVPEALALEALEAHHELFRLAQPRLELSLQHAVVDDQGRHHVLFHRRVGDLPVWGEDLVVHLEPSGEMYAFNGIYSATPADPVAAVTISRANAVDGVVAHALRRQPLQSFDPLMRRLLQYDGPQADLCLHRDTASGRLQPVWRVEIRPNFRDRLRYFVDAVSGEIVDWYNATATDGPTTATGIDLSGRTRTLQVYEADGAFLMVDGSRPTFASTQPDLFNDPIGALVTLDARAQDLSAAAQVFHVLSEDNTWTDPTSVSAHHNMGVVFEYYRNTHGREGIDGAGGTMLSVIHVTEEGESMGNAYWNGVVMAYGDGDDFLGPLAASLDVAGHEMTHGVIERTVNLEYRQQPGALNESFADVFGAMVDRDDWLIGEDVVDPDFFPSGALRDMSTPANGDQPGHMSEYVTLPDSIDNGGVHINSGIPNRACFLIAEAIGRDKTEQIYYRILEARYLNIKSNFVDMRRAAITAAIDLFGDGSEEFEAVAAAFTEVGIVGDGGYELPEQKIPIEGDQWLLVTNADGFDTSLFLVRPAAGEVADIVQLTTTQTFAQTGNSVTVDPAGELVMFVDADNFIRAIDSDGTDEEILSEVGEWSSIALSPDGTTLAATTVFIDTTIYIFDLADPDRSTAITLYSPTTQEGITDDIVLFADAMSWDPNGEFLIYDAFNSIPTATGDELSYWTVNLLSVTDDYIIPLFPPQPEGFHLGNPAFANTTSQYAVFDLFDETTESNSIWVHDLFTGDVGFILESSSFSFPSFSPEDDELVYEYFDEEGVLTVARIELSADRLTAAGPPQDFLLEAQSAKWLVLSDPATAVGEVEEAEALGLEFALAPNVPNPFNPATTIPYQLQVAGRVELTIHDVRGALVRRLVAGPAEAGAYQAVWDGSDEAGRAAASGVYVARLRVEATGTRGHALTRRMALVR